MKTAIDILVEELCSLGFIENPDDLLIRQKVKEAKQTELDQLRAAYNNSCHEISFDEYYRNKYERKEQISPKDMGDNKEA